MELVAQGGVRVRLAGVQRNGDSLGRRLRREVLALRVVTVTMRIALRELDRLPPSADRITWGQQLSQWLDGVLGYHRGRIALLRDETVALPSVVRDDPPDRITGLWGELERALAEAEGIARETSARIEP